MNSTSTSTSTSASVAVPEDAGLLESVTDAVRRTGTALSLRYSTEARPGDRGALSDALGENERSAAGSLRAALTAARPAAAWVGEEQEFSPLPPGEWWAADAVEGNVNLVHGLPEWSVNATLIRDNEPVLTVVHQPVGDLTYTAAREGGAFVNGARLRVSAKADLSLAIATTGQAEAGQRDTYRLIGASITAMLEHALLVRATVPTTFPMLRVATGHEDLFWQYQPSLPGVAAGVLLITEAGGVVTDLGGDPWRPGSPGILAGAPGAHAGALKVLAALH
ncbi:inositol monophosphatase family protein [Streptomyces sp. NPDC048277]|uniref:inositol monophosphatase family protein n=1 Tax=Streptomyces sp. NPDC048277 TaxID=3155027 RepID=UPI0033E4ACC3